MNLNNCLIRNADGPESPLKDFSATSDSKEIEVIFRDLENELIKRISRADVVLGCVAWLTSEKIISALADRNGVSIVVQKEDFLRPDTNSNNNWKMYLHELYGRLRNGVSRMSEGLESTVLNEMSYMLLGQYIEPIRCVGNLNSEKQPAFPRMHNKFLVFCHELKASYGPNDSRGHNFIPYEVWTGSFNFTKNANNSFENAVIIRDKKVVNSFFNEYAQIAALSEPLDWKSEWMAPEWRIGS